jgi:hypothetical protein
MMNEIKKNELNDMEMDNVTGGAFRAAGHNQDAVITLENIVNAFSDAVGQATSKLRTDSIRLRTDSIK